MWSCLQKTWIHNLNEFTCFLSTKNEQQHFLYSVRTASFDLSKVVVKVHVNVASVLSSFMHLSGLLWRCPASMKNISVVLEWRCPARAFSRALSFWPRSTTRSGTHSICTSMKSFHAIRKEIKSEGLLATFFFFFPWLHHKGAQEQWRHWVVAALDWDVLLKRTASLWGHAGCGPIFSEWSA